MDIKGLMKKVGKGILVAAASMVAGVALGPMAGGAVGSLVAKKMAELGVSIDADAIGDMIQRRIKDTPEGIARLFERKQMDGLAKEIARELGIRQDEAFAALQYGLRELQNTLSGIVEELKTNQSLLLEVLHLAQESDSKIGAIMENTSRIEVSISQVDTTLRSIERQLERVFKEFSKKYSTARLDYERLLIISRLHRQNAILASRYGICYDPDLYVPRLRDEETFEDFLSDVGLTDRNVFLVLGDVGMGKTWFLSRLSSITLGRGYPSFFVTLRQGIRSLTGILNRSTLPEFVSELESVISSSDQHAFIFLDGLDEMPGREARVILGNIATTRSNAVSFVLSCRIADWTVDDSIVQASHDLRHSIFENQEATHRAASLGIRTPVSVLLTEFTEPETRAAIERYGITHSIPPDLHSLIRRPFILRLVAQWSAAHGSVPSPSSPEFLDLMAGDDNPADSILGRLGIITQRETLFEIVKRFILERRDRLLLSQLPVDPESDTFQTIVSSGILQLSVGRVGTNVTINQNFIIPLIALTMERFSMISNDYDALRASLEEWLPDVAASVERLLGQPKSPFAPIQTQGRSTPVDQAQSSTALPDSTEVVPPIGRLLADEDKDVRSHTVEGASKAASRLPDSTEVVGHVQSRRQSEPTDAAQPSIILSDPKEIVDLLRPLLRDDMHVRGAAAVGLGLVATALAGSTEIIDLLRPLLRDKEPYVRYHAAWGLGLAATTLPNPNERVDLLRRLFEGVNLHSASALGLSLAATSLPNPSERVAVIRPLLTHKSSDNRRGAALGMGIVATTLPDPTEVIDLLRPLLSDEDVDAPGYAALGLSLAATTLPDPTKVIDLLRPLLDHKDVDVRIRTMRGLSLVATTLPDPKERVGLFRSLFRGTHYQHSAQRALCLGLVATSLPDSTYIVHDLQETIDRRKGLMEIRDTLFGGIPSDRIVMNYAVWGLGLAATTLPDPKKRVELLRPLLRDKDVRKNAAFGMGLVATTLPDPKERVELLRPLLRDKDEDVRGYAALGLGLVATTLPDPRERVELLRPLLRDKDWAVRKNAALGLALTCYPVGRIPFGYWSALQDNFSHTSEVMLPIALVVQSYANKKDRK